MSFFSFGFLVLAFAWFLAFKTTFLVAMQAQIGWTAPFLTPLLLSIISLVGLFWSLFQILSDLFVPHKPSASKRTTDAT
jgi:hypothetical protein